MELPDHGRSSQAGPDHRPDRFPPQSRVRRLAEDVGHELPAHAAAGRLRVPRVGLVEPQAGRSDRHGVDRTLVRDESGGPSRRRRHPRFRRWCRGTLAPHRGRHSAAVGPHRPSPRTRRRRRRRGTHGRGQDQHAPGGRRILRRSRPARLGPTRVRRQADDDRGAFRKSRGRRKRRPTRRCADAPRGSGQDLDARVSPVG